MDRSAIKERIKTLIKERGETITSFAEKAGLTRNNLSIVLNAKDGHASSAIIYKLAEMDVDLNWLFHGTNKNESKIEELEQELQRKQDLIDSLERILKSATIK